MGDLARLLFGWLDTGELDPSLVNAVCNAISRVSPDRLAEAAESGFSPVDSLRSMPWAVTAARAALGRDRLSVLAGMPPSEVLKVIDVVVDRLLEKSPEHGLILFAYKGWILKVVMEVMGLLAEAREGQSGNVVDFVSRKTGKDKR